MPTQPRLLPFIVLTLCAGALTFALSPTEANAEDVEVPEDAKVLLEQLSSLREVLSYSIAREEEFARRKSETKVCEPVAERLRRWAAAHDAIGREVSARPRRPENTPTEEEQAAIKAFARDPHLVYLARRSVRPEGEGIAVFRRITTSGSCLHCHGQQESRPPFVEERYPEDLAWGHRAGQLQGIFSLWLPRHSAEGVAEPQTRE